MAFDIAPYIDHTVLKPTTVDADIVRLCEEAKNNKFAAVCVPPYFINKAVSFLEGSSVKVTTVIGFPFGYSSTGSKLEEITQAIADGADELDIVHNMAALKIRDYNTLEEEMSQCVALAHSEGKVVKVIIESGVLTDAEVIHCCKLYASLNVDFVKTSTGYAETGATAHAVRLMRANLPVNIAIKASGGIRNFTFAKELIAAGATRLGCSAGMQILEESKMAE
ncbi:MAG: deoxyribose-phosphate aldolase [Sphingobacteriales bacterium]|nr:MAG: deoxyribose-phosphate aldolase [Sphingobacteriales bacterium]